jgi:hypothetical protein
LAIASDEQYESIPDDEITLLVRKFCTLHKSRKERRRSPRGWFGCGDTTHFIADCPKRKNLDSTNKYDYTNRNDFSNKGDNNKKYRFRDKKKKKFQKIMSRVCATLSNFDFSSDDSSNSEEDEKVKHKQGDFTGLCLMGKSSRNISDSDSDVSDDLSLESVSLSIIELDNALCNQDKLLCKVFVRTRKWILNLKLFFLKLLLFDQCTMIWVLNHVVIANDHGELRWPVVGAFSCCKSTWWCKVGTQRAQSSFHAAWCLHELPDA